MTARIEISRIWSEAAAVVPGGPVARYLASMGWDAVDQDTVRQHPALPHRRWGAGPAMVAAGDGALCITHVDPSGTPIACRRIGRGAVVVGSSEAGLAVAVVGHDAAFRLAAGVSAGGWPVAVIAAADVEDLARVALPDGLSRLLIGVAPGLVDVRTVRGFRGLQIDNPRFGRAVGEAAAGQLQARAWRAGAKAAVVPLALLTGDIAALFSGCW